MGPWKAVQRQGKPTGYLLHLVKEHLNADSDIPISSFVKSLDNRRGNLMKTKSAKNEFELDALMGEELSEYTLPVKRCIQQQPDTHSAAKKAKTVSAIEHEAVCTANQDIAVEFSTLKVHGTTAQKQLSTMALKSNVMKRQLTMYEPKLSNRKSRERQPSFIKETCK